jgi:Na+-translocating ferredoxin:NAD+ oxidoreductase RnfA subunit
MRTDVGVIIVSIILFILVVLGCNRILDWRVKHVEPAAYYYIPVILPIIPTTEGNTILPEPMAYVHRF